jgi:CubicO group peptidase (beta-lactamase class C family)
MSEGKIIYAKGFGLANLETGTKVTPDSVFMIGSITKQFTAAAIMVLAEQGKLTVDDPISRYFPDFPRGQEVTIRQLLTHTSGVRTIMMPGAPPTPEQALKLRTTADVVALIRGLPDLYDFQPGTSFEYSNSNYWLLGAIVEKVSGVSLGDFLKRNIFDRAGMTATSMDERTEVVPNRVSGYGRAPGSSVFTNPRPALLNVSGGGAAGLHSTVGDLLRWQDALLAGRIVSPESVKAMTTPATLNNGAPLPPDAPACGFGFLLGEENGHAFITHGGGSTGGFNANMKAYPNDNVAFVVLTNISPAAGGPLPKQGPRLSKQGPPPFHQGKRRIQGADGAAMELSRLLSEMIAGPRQPGRAVVRP